MTTVIGPELEEVIRTVGRVRKGLPTLIRFYTEYGFRFELTGWGLGAKRIAGMIAKDCLGGRFRPDTIVQIVPGGQAVGMLMAGNYSNTILDPRGKFPPMLSLMPIHRNDGESPEIEFDVEVLNRQKWAFRGCNVLIVDGEIFTGRTLKAAKKVIKDLGAVSVRTAAIYQRSNIDVTADYFAELRRGDERMPKPWKMERHLYESMYE